MPSTETSLLLLLQALEVELHKPAARRDTTRLNALLHDDFREFGRSGAAHAKADWTYPDLTDTLGLDLHFAAEVSSALAGMAALALLCISFSKLMGDF